MTTVQYVTAVAMALVVFVGMANAVVDLYARGAVRAAVDEGARAGAPYDASTTACTARAEAVVATLVGGDLGRGIRIDCHERRGEVEARARVDLVSWLPGLPDWSFALTARAFKEEEP
jgi:hypothetical protein